MVLNESEIMSHLERMWNVELHSSRSNFLLDFTKELVINDKPLSSDHLKAYELILKRASNVNAQDAEGNTPLIYIQSALNYAEYKNEDNPNLTTLKDIALRHSASKSIRNREGISVNTLEKHLVNYRKYGSIIPPQERESKQGFNWVKALTSTIGFVAGGGLELDTQAQADFLIGITQDSMPGVQGISNTTNALNSATQRYQAQSAQQPQPSSSSYSNANIKDHYRPKYKACGLPSPQANALCQSANVYYDQYVKAAQSNSPNAEQLYDVHKRSVRDMLYLLNNTRPPTQLELGSGSNSAPDQTATRTNSTTVTKPLPCDAAPGRSCAIAN